MKISRAVLAGGVSAVVAATATGVVSPMLSVADTNEQSAAKLVVFPGMSIVQGENRCTLGYVDPVARTGLTAGHCNAAGPVNDLAGNHIGDVVVANRNLPATGTIRPEDVISDFEGISLAPGVEPSDTLPNGTRLRLAHDAAPTPGLPVCLLGSVSGDSCGKVDEVNNGWFTMSDVKGDHGDSGGPVYTVSQPGEGVLVGIYSIRWGGRPAAMSWPAIAAGLAAQPIPRS